MNSLLELLKKSTVFLEKKGIDGARLQSELIFAGTLKCRRLDLYLQFDRPLTTAQVDALRERIVRRARREPVQYIVGDTDFRALTLKCDPRALIPRPETEELVGFVLKKLNAAKPAGTPARVLDLGTGTGAIALSVAAERAGTTVVAVDNSADALALARENAAATAEKLAAVGSRIEFIESDWFENVSESAGAFDAIVSNPPYLTEDEWESAQPEVRDREPRGALVADDNGFAALEKILRGARNRLVPAGGFVAFETGIAHRARLEALAHDCGFAETESLTDLSGRDRFFFAFAQHSAR